MHRNYHNTIHSNLAPNPKWYQKIVAFISSQLGLIIVTIDSNRPYLAFLHIHTYAFFKAILFLYSKSIFHNLNDEQDIWKIGSLFKALPFTTTSLIRSLVLIGMPFLKGSYSKDLIIEIANTSYTNASTLLITLIDIFPNGCLHNLIFYNSNYSFCPPRKASHQYFNSNQWK